MVRTLGASLLGIDGVPVEVEVRIHSLLPRVDIVGLPEAAVRESAARVRGAIASLGRRFPDRRITVNLAPAGVRKNGAGLDLPIAIGILGADAAFEPAQLEGHAFVGELALDGRLRPVQGALSLVIAARDAGCRHVIVPAACAEEAALAPGIRVLAAADLASVCAHLCETELLPEATPIGATAAELPAEEGPCLGDVRGQEGAKRALVIAAAGGHAILLQGPPGAGKTMLARRLPGLLPSLDFDEALEVTRIHSAARPPQSGSHFQLRLARRRPFRAPHHSASSAGLLGGGQPPRPGEVSLAHRGVLFLDELTEFDRRSLDALRQVLEERSVSLARARFSCSFPAHFQLVAACNPCPCGFYGSPLRDCHCDDAALLRYRRRLSGPLLDRIDLHVRVPAVPWSELDRPASGSSGSDGSEAIRERICESRQGQRERAGLSNAEIPDRRLDELVAASAEARELLGRAVERLALSARAARRVLRVARTIADLAGERGVNTPAVAEALGYRAESGGEQASPAAGP